MKFWIWIQVNSLWLVGVGLMLASSGLDGVYMSQWMPVGFGWLGFVLNTMADIASPILTYWFGRLQQGTKKQRALSFALVPAEIVGVFYSGLFSWRRLLVVLKPIEPEAYVWMSWLAAGFIPLLLAFIGFAQSLLVGKFKTETATVTGPTERAPLVPVPNETEIETPLFLCETCGAGFETQRALAGHGNAHRRANGHRGNGKKEKEPADA